MKDEERGCSSFPLPDPWSSGPVHIPVLLKETMEILAVNDRGVYVDATVGLGGHAAVILSMLGPSGRFLGIDRDDEALSHARRRLGNGRVYLRKGDFSSLGEILLSLDLPPVDGVLFDLGMSMLQVKGADRGFSFLTQERLDMRMDTSQELTAWEVVNNYPGEDLGRILWEYGEERYARRIAKKIVLQRKRRPIDTCSELAGLVTEVYGKRGRRHPATRTFQALRIEVNAELDELKKGLESASKMLRQGGRLAVISYHSVEERVVKNFFKEGARLGF